MREGARKKFGDLSRPSLTMAWQARLRPGASTFSLLRSDPEKGWRGLRSAAAEFYTRSTFQSLPLVLTLV